MGQVQTKGILARASLGACALALFCLAFSQVALAGSHHPRKASLDIEGLNHACGVATDSKGDLYASSAGEGKIKVYNPSHVLLTEISDANEPCGLAVGPHGEVLVSEKATGNVVAFVPNAYPFSGTPTYGSAATVNASGKAKGIAVDRFDNRLYVAEGDRVSTSLSEVQSVKGTASGGTYKLKFEGQETASLLYNASNAEVTVALEALAALGPGDVVVSGTPSAGFSPHQIAFGGARSYTDVPQVEALPSLTGNEVQKLIINATGGTYKLTFEGQQTAPILFNAPATGAGSLQEALEALFNLAPGDISVTGETGEANPYLITFKGAYANKDVGQMTRDKSALTGAATVETSTPGPAANVSTEVAGSSGFIGEGALTEASGVAAFTYPEGLNTDHYLWVADAKGGAPDSLYLFGGTDVKALNLRRELTGTNTPDGSFGFGTAGAYLAADPGNRNSKGECKVVGEAQACTAGHLFLYDAAHKALDEFDATGEYLDQTKNPAFADAEPTAIAIERSGGTNDGTLYVTAGAGTGAKALAFGPLKAPSRKALKKPSEEAGGLSQELKNARAVATDSYGNVYLGADSQIRIFSPKGEAITTIEDEHKPTDIAIDSACNVYVLDENKGIDTEAEVTYYEPSQCPPDSATTYERHSPPVTTPKDFPKGKHILKGIAVNPGPGEGKDRLFVTSFAITHEYDSAENESELLEEEFAPCVPSLRQSIAVNGANGNVYFGVNIGAAGLIYVASKTGECLSQFKHTGSANGQIGGNPYVAVDQSNGHVVEYDQTKTAREYDASGSFVAEFGNFTEGLGTLTFRLAVDNACALQEPPLTGAACKAFDPANGTAYVAFADTSATHPPYKGLNAFGPLDYGATPPTPEYELKVTKPGTGSGKVTSSPPGIDCGSTCNAKFKEDVEVTLSQVADPGSKFVKWGGACSGTGECKVSMSKAKEVTAEFESTETLKFPLKVVIEGPGSGKVTSSPAGIECTETCEAPFFKNAKVTLTATEGESSKFDSWTGCDANPTATQCEVSITGSREVKVKFKVETPLLTVVKKGGGTGKVISEPAGIDCGSTCSAQFTLNEAVTLKASADPGSTFSGWEVVGSPGTCPGTGSCLVTMSKAKEVKATFGALPKAKAKQTNPVLYKEATLRGEVDPSGLATEYLFEYLSEEEYDANGETFEGAKSTPVGELSASSGFVAVKAALTGLEEGTAYRFALLAQNSVGMAEGEGSFVTLQRRPAETCPNTTYRFGLSAALPDCRAYELVTPGQTSGLNVRTEGDGGTLSGSFSNWLTPQRDAGAGERLSYFTAGTLPGFEGNGLLDAYRAERGAGDHPADGWQSAIFSPNYVESAPTTIFFPFQHGIAADQLYSIWESNPKGETFPETLPHGVYLRTPEGFEVLGQGSLGTDLEALSRYVSPGGAHAIFISKEHLEAKAAPQGTEAIYDRAAGEASAEVISVKPDGTAFGAGEGATYLGTTEDGSAVAFRVSGTLYLHREGETTEIAESPNTFAGVSEDGTRVFYVASANGEAAAPLHVCDTETGPCAGTGAHSSEKIATLGIFALVSPDGSRAFFSSTEALTGSEENDNGEEAEAGKRNLYAWDGTDSRFVGQLSASDFNQNGFADIAGMNLAAWTRAISLTIGAQYGRSRAPTRSTPDGSAFVFQSHARLTPYDNEGVGEIYRYEPAAEEGERLACVSCDPSGAPPSEDALLDDVLGPVLQGTTMIANLTDSGEEVFFQSFDQLLPEDANEVEDVYEWRAKGSHECTRPGGCLALISSGQGEVPSFLYAMSANGRDVFIQTKEKLVGADVPGSPSIYDAREGGGIPEPTPTAPCQGDACQGTGTQAPVLPAPGTSGAAEGNATPAPPARSRCAKGKHRVKGRCVAVKKHHKQRKRHHRAHSNRGGNR